MEKFEFCGLKDGPTLLILGGVHGNEPAGIVATRRLVDGLQSRALTLNSGRVVCVPLVNGPAFEKDVRFIDRNLNRILGEEDASDIEGAIAQNLRPILRDCDYLLDLHSYTAGGPPFLFGADDAKTMAFAASLPASCVITGWDACYKAAFPDKPAPGMGTTEYARAHGVCGVTYECGQHKDLEGPDNGYAAILGALAHTGLMAAANGTASAKAPRHIEMRHVFVKQSAGDFVKPWKHLEEIRAGEAFARFDDGTVQAASQDGLIILPHRGVGIGTEWGYLGV